MANLTGSILGASVVVLLEPLLKRAIKLDASKASLLQLVIYGLALVVLMRVRPQGALPEGFSIWRWLRGERGKVKRLEMSDDWVPTSIKIKRADRRADTATASAASRCADDRWHSAPVVLETSGVSKRFGGIIAAEDLRIELRRGTITALVGPNGAGKTTVFNLLTGGDPAGLRLGAAERLSS